MQYDIQYNGLPFQTYVEYARWFISDPSRIANLERGDVIFIRSNSIHHGNRIVAHGFWTGSEITPFWDSSIYDWNRPSKKRSQDCGSQIYGL
jgi:hypothetical protein